MYSMSLVTLMRCKNPPSFWRTDKSRSCRSTSADTASSSMMIQLVESEALRAFSGGISKTFGVGQEVSRHHPTRPLGTISYFPLGKDMIRPNNCSVQFVQEL